MASLLVFCTPPPAMLVSFRLRVRGVFYRCPSKGCGEMAINTYGYSTSGGQEAMLKEQYSRSSTWRMHRTHWQYRHAQNMLQ
ncbi:hypothetical protein BKA56DRAFT_576169 [Ilyonectria sp. MPI-CAGE-AT-0026]|nr:hypothetical protein BKA56DRAFT_576169 [Ilyonectria sp. MPI-CAGE-AT-0026]